jgi:N-methylhydantoinase A
VDIRYQGQGFEVEVPIDGIALDGRPDAIAGAVTQSFARAYTEEYGRTLPSGALEAVTWRIEAAAPRLPRELAPVRHGGRSSDGTIGARRAYFGPARGYAECAVHDRYGLEPGTAGTGPALVQERETTVVVAPGTHWRVDEHWNLRVSRASTTGNGV